MLTIGHLIRSYIVYFTSDSCCTFNLERLLLYIEIHLKASSCLITFCRSLQKYFTSETSSCVLTG